MFEIGNDQLRVTLLDPEADRARLGARYCTGGYVFQVADRVHGDLLSGPTYPASFNWFDGQGIPDGFNWGPLQSLEQPGKALVIGVGLCDLQARSVIAFCDWEVGRRADELRFTTRQAWEGYTLTLERTVAVRRRTVRSSTVLANVGERYLSVRWFPHPFYPPAGPDLFKPNIPFDFPEHPAYERGESGFLRRRGGPWDQAGHNLTLDHRATSNLVVHVRHPALGLVAATFDYVPGFFLVWGNTNTFSFEPFLERTVGPGHTLAWSVDYDF